MMLAGCSGETTGSDPDDDGSSSDATDSGGSTAGTFRLLISDQPVAIDDFDELNVSFDRASIFSEDAEEAEEETDDTETESEIEDDEPAVENETDDDEPEDIENETEDEPEAETEAETKDEPEDETEDDGPDDDDERGFHIIELDNATVDLTQVVGDKAVDVFEGDLEEGRYTKIELYAADVEGIVEGEPVDVMIPSGKLQIVKPFEVVAGETLSFVFDINVVKKGQGQEYNLLPVISESGVAEEDVEVEEVGTEDTEATEAPNGTDAADEN
ncbi:MAG: DUF4382 domain-containing protein, partial [Natronomonas sp.]